MTPSVNSLLGYYPGAVKSGAAAIGIASDLHRLAQFAPQSLEGYSDAFDESKVVSGDALIDVANPSNSEKLSANDGA